MDSSLKLWEAEKEASDWTFASAPTRDLTHCYHDYPARMIPQVAARLLETYAPQADFLFDPYCGSGTSLVEGMIRGVNVIGVDLNPLAYCISKAKIATPHPAEIQKRISELDGFIVAPKRVSLPAQIDGISRLDFWFKPQVVEKLSILKSYLDELTDEETRLFFQVAFSETVRESSNTRNEEFKLYRYEPERLDRFEPDVFSIMLAKLKRNLLGLKQFLARLREVEPSPRANVHQFNTTSDIPSGIAAQATIDIIVTSPPYGDSHTTVAYGQYSRLSSAWLGLESPEKVDRRLMGGTARKSIPDFPHAKLNNALEAIKQKDEKRACEVAAFYADLQTSITHVATLIKLNGHACYVVGNRKVKGIVLPTDDAIRAFFETQGFEHVETFQRRIPNKRMPSRNSPTNAVGKVENTMTTEHIVVMRRVE